MIKMILSRLEKYFLKAVDCLRTVLDAVLKKFEELMRGMWYE